MVLLILGRGLFYFCPYDPFAKIHLIIICFFTKFPFRYRCATFEVPYEFELAEDITIPARCILDFQGGSISAGGNDADTITGNGTGIRADLVKIFGTGVSISGTWYVRDIYSEWFQNVESENSVQEVFKLTSGNVINNVYLENKTFLVSLAENGFAITLNAYTNVYMKGSIQMKPNALIGARILKTTSNCLWDGGTFIGDKDDHLDTAGEYGHGMEIDGSNIVIRNVKVQDMWGDGIYIADQSKNVIVENYNIVNVSRNGISCISPSNIKILNGLINGVRRTAPCSGIDVEPNAQDNVNNVVISNLVCEDSVCGVSFYGSGTTHINVHVENVICKDTVDFCMITTPAVSYNVNVSNLKGKNLFFRNSFESFKIENSHITGMPREITYFGTTLRQKGQKATINNSTLVLNNGDWLTPYNMNGNRIVSEGGFSISEKKSFCMNEVTATSVAFVTDPESNINESIIDGNLFNLQGMITIGSPVKLSNNKFNIAGSPTYVFNPSSAYSGTSEIHGNTICLETESVATYVFASSYGLLVIIGNIIKEMNQYIPKNIYLENTHIHQDGNVVVAADNTIVS